MKKTMLLFAMLLLGVTAMAQTADNDTTARNLRQTDYEWVSDGNSVYIPYSNANVGIRTDYPQEALHVNGFICGDGGHRALRVRTECGTTTIGADSWAYSHFNTDRPRFYFYKPIMVQDGCISSSSQTNLKLQTFNYNGSSLDPITRMTILYSNGNVGIGTSTPAYKLDVNGTIRANEVLVNIPSGADFVFENGYQLMPLDELSEYVQQNRHLPEVKSAAEMKQDGMTMGEMQIKLLQKIEELTLYIIQQEQRINELESKLKQ